MIYKPSSLFPNLNEIDILSTDGNQFSAQANTLGNSVKAYSINILSGDGAVDILRGTPQNLGVEIQNKKQLLLNTTVTSNESGKNDTISFVEQSKKSTTLICTTEEDQELQNGKDYQWNIRMYENHSPRVNQELPITQVCTGFSVGSTTSVIWVDLSGITDDATKQEIKDQLLYDRWVEISCSSKDDLMMPITIPNKDNLDYPDTWPFKQRIQINWVYTDLGWDKDVIKLELMDKFTYNYKNGKPFSIYTVSNEHTTTSFYVEPNDDIELGYYISINSEGSSKAKKIIGYGQTTGEIRLQEPLDTVPKDGDTYQLWNKASINDSTLTEVTGNGVKIVGGKAITNDAFKIMTSYWNSETDHQLFVQPNINIKSDINNPNQIVYSNGVRININQKISSLGQYAVGKKFDITFNKLDNTQWLLKNNCTIDTNSNGEIQDIIVPQTDYVVYTDFMDSIPNAFVYARNTPTIEIKYKDYRELEDETIEYNKVDSSVPAPYRDIAFKAYWDSPDNVEPKYYRYYLYMVDNYNNELLMGESEDIYDYAFEWNFMGAETNKFYKVKIIVWDKYGNQFSQENLFYIEYRTYASTVPLSSSVVCDEQAVKLEIVSPVYVTSTDKGEEKTVVSSNVKLSNDSKYYYLDTSDGKVLNYTQVTDMKNTPIQLPQVFSLFTRFKFPYVNEESTSEQVGFFNDIVGNDMKTLIEVAHANYSELYFPEEDEVVYAELYSTLYTRQANQYLLEAISTHYGGISIVLYTNSSIPLKDNEGNIIYFTLKEYNTSSAKIILEEKINSAVLNFDHYEYYDKASKTLIGSSTALAEAGIDRREIYLSIFTEDSSEDDRQRVLSYDPATGRVDIAGSLTLDDYNNLSYKAYTLKSESNYIPLPSGTEGIITLGGDLYTVKVGGLDAFTIDTENKIIKKNANSLKMKVFKNNSTEPLQCFDNGASTYYDLQSLLTNSGIGISNKVGFALQYKYQTDDNGEPITNGFGEKQIKYELVEEFKEEAEYMDPDVIYILTKDIVFGPVWKEPTNYYMGEYKYIINEDGNGDWILQVDTEYVYLDEGGDYKDDEGNPLNIVIDPSLTQAQTTGNVKDFRWGPNPNVTTNKSEEDFIWMPNAHAARQTNLSLIAQKWFDFNITVDNSKEINPVLSSVVLVDE